MPLILGLWRERESNVKDFDGQPKPTHESASGAKQRVTSLLVQQKSCVLGSLIA